MTTDSKTDWKRLAEMTDKDIDTSEIPELDKDFFNHAKRHTPTDQSTEEPSASCS